MKKVAAFSFLFLAALSVAEGAPFKLSNEPATDAKKGRKADVASESIGANSVMNTIDKVNFAADFGYMPGARWKRSIKYNEVTFLKDRELRTAYYDTRGVLIGTTSERKFSDLPVSAQREINSRYKDYKIGEVILFNDSRHNSTDGIIYGVKFQNAENYFLEMTKSDKRIIVEVNPEGEVYLYREL